MPETKTAPITECGPKDPELAQEQYKSSESTADSAMYDMEIAAANLHPEDKSDARLIAIQKELDAARGHLAKANELAGYDTGNGLFDIEWEFERNIFCTNPQCGEGVTQGSQEARKDLYGMVWLADLEDNNAVYRCGKCGTQFVSTIDLIGRDRETRDLVYE